MTCAPRNKNTHDDSSDDGMIPTKAPLKTTKKHKMNNSNNNKNYHRDEEQQQSMKMALQKARFRVELPTVISALAATRSVLPAGYEPRPCDVKCGRGKGAYNQPGNVQFRQVVERYMQPYLQSRTVMEKTALLNAIIDEYQDSSHGGRFIRRQDGRWMELSREDIRAKVGHAMRQVIAVAHKKGGSNSPSPPTVSSADVVTVTNIANHHGAEMSGKIDHDFVPQQPEQEEPLARVGKIISLPKVPATMDTTTTTTSTRMSRFEELVAHIVQQRATNPLYVLPRSNGLSFSLEEENFID